MEDSTIIYEKDHATVTYYPTKQMIGVKWDGNVSVDQYRETFMSALEHAKKGFPVKRFYSDTREQGVVGPENRKWFENEMLPKAIEAGLERAGAISSANVFKRYYLNMLLKSVGKFNLPFKLCGSEEEVIEFLMKDEKVAS
jgi:hypothetical protein